MGSHPRPVVIIWCDTDVPGAPTTGRFRGGTTDVVGKTDESLTPRVSSLPDGKGPHPPLRTDESFDTRLESPTLVLNLRQVEARVSISERVASQPNQNCRATFVILTKSQELKVLCVGCFNRLLERCTQHESKVSTPLTPGPPIECGVRRYPR